jgi:hypothetical protein
MLTPVLAYSKLTRVYLENIIHVISSKHIHDINWLNYNISSRWNLRPGYDSPNPNHHSSDVTTWGHYNPFRTRGVCVYIYMYIYILDISTKHITETKHVMRYINQRYLGDITKPNIRFGYICCSSLLIRIFECVNGKAAVNIKFD